MTPPRSKDYTSGGMQASVFCLSVAFSCIECIECLYHHTFVTTIAEFVELYECVFLLHSNATSVLSVDKNIINSPISPVVSPALSNPPTLVAPSSPTSHLLTITGHCKQENVEKNVIEEDNDGETQPRLLSSAVAFPPEQSILKEHYNLEPKSDQNRSFSKPPATGNCKQENLEKNVIEEDNDDETQPRLLSAVAIARAPERSVVRECYNLEPKLDQNRSFWDTGIIPIVTSDYRQSRTAIKVSGPSICNIAQNIFTSNKARSVHAIYDKATAKCKTTSYLKFTIRLLYLSKNMDVVLVDVRRVSGCAMAFRDEYQTIYQAVLPGLSTPQQLHGGMMKSFAGFESMDIPDIPIEEDIIERSLETSMVNLESKMYDTRIITLQDLQLTTSPESKQTSSTACKLILGKYDKILEYVVQDIMKRVENTGFNEDDSEEYLRSLSLNILVNLLSSKNNYHTLDSLMQKSHWIVPLIASLVWYVTMATNYPWNACLAAKCLRLLAPNFSTQQANVGVHSALENAERYGNVKYDLLEKEAKAALLVLDV